MSNIALQCIDEGLQRLVEMQTLLQTRPDLFVRLPSRSQPTLEIRAGLGPCGPLPLNVPHSLATVDPLHGRTDIMERRGLRRNGRRHPGLVRAELLELGGEQRRFDALSSAIEEQEM